MSRNPRGVEATERQIAVAEALANGACIQKTMIDNGYSAATASTGLAGVPKASLKLLLEKTNPDLLKFVDLGISDMRTLVLARLNANVTAGRDGGVLSAKALGSLKELTMFQAESQVGIVIVQAPGADEVQKLMSGDKECE